MNIDHQNQAKNSKFSILSQVLLGKNDDELGKNLQDNMNAHELVSYIINSHHFKDNVLSPLVFVNKSDTSRFIGKTDFDVLAEFSDLMQLNDTESKDFCAIFFWNELFKHIFKLDIIAKIIGLNEHRLIYNIISSFDYNWKSAFPLSEVENKYNSFALNVYDKEIVEASGLFDPIWYLETYQDIAPSGIDPITHYMVFGAFEYRNPSAIFDSKKYVLENPDVAEAKSNPLLHWIKYGKAEGRSSPLLNVINAELDSIGIHPAIMTEVEKIVRSSGYFSDSYYLSSYPDVAASGISPIHHYLNHGWLENRNPSSEFDTWFYKKSNPQHAKGLGGGLLHYISHGKNAAEQSRPEYSVTFHPRNIIDTEINGARIAIHLHIYYSDTIEEFCAAFKNIPFAFDIYVSACFKQDVEFLRNVISRELPNCSINISHTENRGRDFGSFMQFLELHSKKYDFVCHLHSKKSKHASFGESWRHWIIDSMFGKNSIPEDCVRFMLENPKVGMIYPDNYHEIKTYIKQDDNEKYFGALSARIGIGPLEVPGIRLFPAGSMTWLRVSAIKNLVDAKIQLNEFDQEDKQVDHTLAHVLERAITLIVQANGYVSSCYYLSSFCKLDYKKNYQELNYMDASTKKWDRDNVNIAKYASLPLSPRNNFFYSSRLDVHWIIPDFGRGAGGHMTIFRMIEQLTILGNRQTIWIQNCYNYASPLEAKVFIQKNYRSISDEVIVRFLPEDMRHVSGDVIIATDLWTVFPARQAQGFKARFYFIQDYEPMFHPMGENYLIAESTYSSDLMALCAGDWLVKKACEHNMWSRCWHLSSDPEFYFPNHAIKVPNRILKIAFYCRSYTPRRATALGISAFQELVSRGLNFELIIFGEESRERNYTGPITEKGILQPDELGKLYRECDIGVVFSTTNYSLVPLEMMACGLPVVEINSESARTAFGDGVVTFVDPDPISVANGIERIALNKEIRDNQARQGLSFISKYSWSKSAALLNNFLIEGLKANKCEEIDPINLCNIGTSNIERASVIIPSLNGGALFDSVLEALSVQKCDFKYDVVILDSGSTDGIEEKVYPYRDCMRIQSIDKAQFQHGRTRNLAISITDSEYVAVITQDAMPCDDRWLDNLLSGFKLSNKVAGVVGRHIAYPQHNKFVERDLHNMFQKMHELSEVYSLDRMLPSFIYPGGIEDRLIKQFYSDNNSAMRRSVWDKLPYPEIDWGEDQVWCWEMLKLGFEKAYVHKAAVYHSHPFIPEKDIEVAMEEGYLFGAYFGVRLGGNYQDNLRSMNIELRKYALQNGIAHSEIDDYISHYINQEKYRLIGFNRSLK